NYNVYFYYLLNGQAPAINDSSNDAAVWNSFSIGWILAVVGIAVSGTAAIIFVLKKAKLAS
ncbi:MAG TPA: hypothetical protein VH621_00810, partial [Nitrososphaera sp.]